MCRNVHMIQIKLHKIYIGSPCSGRVPRAIQPAWAHPARAIIQTTLLAIFPFEKKLRHTNPARPEAWASSGRHFVFFQFHLFLISGAIPKVKKYKNLKKTSSLPPSVWPACKKEWWEEENNYKKHIFNKKFKTFWKNTPSQKHTHT